MNWFLKILGKLPSNWSFSSLRFLNKSLWNFFPEISVSFLMKASLINGVGLYLTSSELTGNFYSAESGRKKLLRFPHPRVFWTLRLKFLWPLDNLILTIWRTKRIHWYETKSVSISKLLKLLPILRWPRILSGTWRLGQWAVPPHLIGLMAAAGVQWHSGSGKKFTPHWKLSFATHWGGD